MNIIENEIFTLTFTDLTKQGEGIGKIDGFTLFVKGALIGDVCEVKVTKLKKNYGFGEIIKIITPSRLRIEPKCQYFPTCGGCTLQHLAYDEQLIYKKKMVTDALERIGGFSDVEVKDTIGMEYPYEYRNKAQFPIRNVNGKPEICMFSQNSHDSVAIDSCDICAEINQEIIKKIKIFMSEYNISGYDEKTNSGLFRHLVTRIGYKTGQVMVSIVINKNDIPGKKRLIELLTEINNITSINLNINTDRTNVIMGKKTKLLWGKEFIEDYIGTTKFRISPLSFFQVNPEQTKKLYDIAGNAAGLRKSDTIIDAYCGIGAISLYLADRFKNGIGIEIIPEAILDARENARINNINNVKFVSGAAEDIVSNLINDGFSYDIIFLDPPRKGCDIKLLQCIANHMPERVLYVSCDPSSLARDLRFLCGFGYDITTVQPVDLFPNTTHVEVVIKLQRKNCL